MKDLDCNNCAFAKKDICKNKKIKYIKLGKVCKKYIPLNSSCMSCKLYSNCKNISKSFNGLCKQYESNNITVNKKKKKKKKEKNTNTIFNFDIDNQIDIINSFKKEKNVEKDFMSMIDDVISSEFNEIPNFDIDDRDFKLAKNFYEFSTSPKFLGVKPFPAQMEIALNIFLDYCPKCSNKKFYKNIQHDCDLEDFEDNLVLLEHGKCPKCKKNRLELVDEGYFNSIYNELAACAGQRSGKSVLVSMLVSYLTHRYLKLQNPSKTYGLIDNQLLIGSFVATTLDQARDSLWQPLISAISSSEWFKDYHSFLNEVGNKQGKELYRLKDTYLAYYNKKLFLHPAVASLKALRGRTRFVGAIDELGYFNTSETAKKINATETYVALGNSLRTVRSSSRRLYEKGYYDIPTAYMFNISSPFAQDDKIMELVRESKKNKRIYAIHKPTWEMNPQITKEDLADEYLKDSIIAERDFGANPPLTNSPFFLIDDIIPAISSKRKNNVLLKHKLHKSKKNVITSYAKLDYMSYKLSDIPFCLSIDAGATNNQFALTLLYQKLEKTIIYAQMVIFPEEGYNINFDLVDKYIIEPLVSELNIVLICADRWNSKYILDKYADDEYDIYTYQYSLKYDDMMATKMAIRNNNLVIPKPEIPIEDITTKFITKSYKEFRENPISYFILQLLTIQNNGRFVLKGNYDDDLWRATALGYTLMQDEDWNVLFNNIEDYEENIDIKDRLAYSIAGYSGYTKSSSNVKSGNTTKSNVIVYNKSKSLLI